MSTSSAHPDWTVAPLFARGYPKPQPDATSGCAPLLLSIEGIALEESSLRSQNSRSTRSSGPVAGGERLQQVRDRSADTTLLCLVVGEVSRSRAERFSARYGKPQSGATTRTRLSLIRAEPAKSSDHSAYTEGHGATGVPEERRFGWTTHVRATASELVCCWVLFQPWERGSGSERIQHRLPATG